MLLASVMTLKRVLVTISNSSSGEGSSEGEEISYGKVASGSREDLTGKAFDWGIARRLLQFLIPHKREMAVGFALMIVSSLLVLLAPYLVKKTFDDYIAVGDLVGLRWIALAAFMAYALDFFVNFYALSCNSEVLEKRDGDSATLPNQVINHADLVSH